MRQDRRRGHLWAALLLVAAGIGLTFSAVTYGWGHLGFVCGVLVALTGVVYVLCALIRRRLVAFSLSAVAIAAVVLFAVILVARTPGAGEKWEDPELSAGADAVRVGDLLIERGAARDAHTGRGVWSVENANRAPAVAATDDLVVVSTEDGLVAVDPIDGTERWRSTVTGYGVAYDDNVLVVASDGTQAIALELSTGDLVWQREGEPMNECKLGDPWGRRGPPAGAQGTIFVAPSQGSRTVAELVTVGDGATVAADVSCQLSARILGDVMIEGDRGSLVGRSVVDGGELWRTHVGDTWSTQGRGSTIIVPSGHSALLVDVATGSSTSVRPPSSQDRLQWAFPAQRTEQVWALVKDTTLKAWNPVTGAVVGIPDAESVRLEGADSRSGWITLEGTTRDFTGEESAACWALTSQGKVHGPYPGTRCTAGGGFIRTNAGVFPLS